MGSTQISKVFKNMKTICPLEVEETTSFDAKYSQ